MQITNSTPNFTSRMVKINEETYIDSGDIKKLTSMNSKETKLSYSTGGGEKEEEFICKPLKDVANKVSYAKAETGPSIDLTA